MPMHHQCYNLGLSITTKSRPSLILTPILSAITIVVHTVARRYSRRYTRIAHSESAYSIHTASLVHDPTFLKAYHATGGREMVGGCNVQVNVFVEEDV